MRSRQRLLAPSEYMFPSPAWAGKGAPERGAGIGATWNRDPLAGCDRAADHGRVAMKPIPFASPGSDPRGSLFRPATRPTCGDATVKVRTGPRGNGALHPASGAAATRSPQARLREQPQKPRPGMVNAALCAPVRITLRETEPGAHPSPRADGTCSALRGTGWGQGEL